MLYIYITCIDGVVVFGGNPLMANDKFIERNKPSFVYTYTQFEIHIT